MNTVSARVAVMALVVLAAASASAGEQKIQLQEAPGRELTAARCVVCHSLDYIPMNVAVMDRAGWERSVQKMIERFGAPISAEEAGKILEYLGTNY